MESYSTHRRDTQLLCAIALATVVIHCWTGTRYGFHRDELATLDDARHLAWGFVAYPPITPLFGRLSLLLFGESLTGFRFFAALAEAAAVIVAGLMARALGGGRSAQVIAAAACLPFCMAAGSLMQYVSFDYLFWVCAAYFVIRLLRDDDPRWWMAIGTAIGLGMMAKYAMVFFVAALGVALLLTGARKYLASKWLWMGAAIALAIVTPNLIWQVRHSFISLEFLRSIHDRDVRMGRAADFLPGQLQLTALAALLAVAGLIYLLRSKQYRAVGLLYLALLGLFVAANGRSYYLAGGYPMLYAAGAVWCEQAMAGMRRSRRVAMRSVVMAALLADFVAACVITLPLAPAESNWGKWTLAQTENLREEVGWQELTGAVAGVYRTVPGATILAANYGEAGAIGLYGPRLGLPAPISGVNSFWERGYGAREPETVIVVGISRKWLEEHFASVELAGHNGNRLGVENEESRDHPDIFVCRGLKTSWAELWKRFRYFG